MKKIDQKIDLDYLKKNLNLKKFIKLLSKTYKHHNAPDLYYKFLESCETTEMNYDKLFEEITSSFYLSEKMDEYYFFENWQSLMYKPNQSIGWYNDYTSTIEIHQLSRNLSSASGNDLGIVCKFRLLDAYPKLISPLALDYSRTNDIQKFTVNWTFRDMIIETPNKENPYNNLWKDRDFLNKGKDFINEGESLFKDVVFL